jgi:hypothetical protein
MYECGPISDRRQEKPRVGATEFVIVSLLELEVSKINEAEWPNARRSVLVAIECTESARRTVTAPTDAPSSRPYFYYGRVQKDASGGNGPRHSDSRQKRWPQSLKRPRDLQ